MQKIVNFLSGNIRVEVETAYPERFMNLCAQNDIAFWDLERVNPVTVRLTISIISYRRMKPLLSGLMGTVKPVRKAGAPVFLWRIRKRYVLLSGLLVTLVVIWVMSLFIWDIEVTGNETVPATDILRALEQVGVTSGTFGPSIDPELVRNEALLYVDGVSWLTVNVNGSRATVVVRERVEKPDMVNEGQATAVYATKSGVIERMIVWNGTSLYEIGDTVLMGEDIVTGRMDSISSGTRFVHADAEVYARTWYEFSMQMPLELAEKAYTGRDRTKSTIFFGRNRINLWFDGGVSYDAYDKMIEESNLTLPGGIVLPIKVQKITFSEYEQVYSYLQAEEAEAVLTERLLEKLTLHMNEGGEIVDTQFTVSLADGVITVSMQAECLEQIAARRVMQEDELTVPQYTEDELREDTEQT